jgi:hypothetical protein
VYHQIPICRFCIADQDCVLHGAFFFFFSPVFSVTQLRACTEFEWNKRMTCAGYSVFCVIAAEAACVCLCVLLEYCPRQYNDGDLAHVAVQSWFRV